MRDLELDTLADLHTLMSHPPKMRRGHTRLLTGIPAPAAGAGYTYTISPDYWERVLAIYTTLTTSAAAGVRVPTITYASADGQPFNVVPLSLAVLPSTVQVISPDVFGTPALAAAPSVTGEGSVTDPGAGATIATTAAVPAGTYTVVASVYVSGTVTAADGNNMQVTGTGVTSAVIAYPGVANTPATITEVVTTTGAGAIAVKAVAAASGAAAVYNADITVTPLSSATAEAQLPDLTLKPGWQVQLAVGGMAAGDQLASVVVLAERYPSNWADGALAADEEGQLRRLATMLADEIRGPW